MPHSFPYSPHIDIRFNPFTTARIDEKLFGEHTGIQTGPIITSPWPYINSHFRTSLKGNPWYMAAGWNAGRRKVDTKFYAGSARMTPKLHVNPWDIRYGYIGVPPHNLEVIRANQMGSMSFV